MVVHGDFRHRSGHRIRGTRRRHCAVEAWATVTVTRNRATDLAPHPRNPYNLNEPLPRSTQHSHIPQMRVFSRSISTSATVASLATAALFALVPLAAHAQRAARPRTAQPRQAEDPRYSQTEKPPLHATHWLAITGKPLSATAGALIFAQGGNAVDAAAAMLAAGCTMWDTLSCGGETQALIY